MSVNRQGRTPARCLLRGLILVGAVLLGCTPIPQDIGGIEWPAVSAMGIWAVEPSTEQVFGQYADFLTFRWSDAELEGTQPTISVWLEPVDANDSSHILATGIDAAADGGGDEWLFYGIDVNGEQIPAGAYVVHFAIVDDPNYDDPNLPDSDRRATDEADETITVPLRFTSPAEDVTIYQTGGLDVTWEGEVFASVVRIDIGLVVDPNATDDVVWMNSQGIQLADGESTVTFDGTVYDQVDPNGTLVEPNTYTVVGKITPTGVGGIGFFFEAPGRVTILADP